MCLCSINNHIVIFYKNYHYRKKIVLLQLYDDKIIQMFELQNSLLYIKRISIKNFSNILVIGN